MPTKTFFNLPKEKQKRLLDAARLEFSRASLAEASIANIVKAAKIPRGSFYQYFENKEDLYFYFFASLQKSSRIDLKAAVKIKKGDLFAGFQLYFEKTLHDILHGPDAAFYQLFFTTVDFHGMRKMVANLGRGHSPGAHTHKCTKENKHSFLSEVDLNDLRNVSASDLKLLFHLMLHIFFSSISDAFQDQESPHESEVLENFNKKMNWLKYGVYRKEGEEHA
ncbi:TetR/AcrR family transcriptional regulator [Enterococcus hirae]|jgi:AcrR family transcriptional regulator|nr:TetR family transcriptional regulator [Enterococcaceae bacterium]MCI1918502.1 TetR family transcriptional regulator [Enterococcaceae bacterium]MDM8212267.1 TetR/AcrR family transcriptional regulator [Enterococcus hirae]